MRRDVGEISFLPVEPKHYALLREWLPKFVGIEYHVAFELGDGSRVAPMPEDEERLTRDDVAATVHYLKFPFSDDQQRVFVAQSARMVVDHPEYQAVAELSDEQRAELARDFTE